ncbi:hypothetical protein BKA80DRAFT_32563 [Phyllosticta citrichinensis]
MAPEYLRRTRWKGAGGAMAAKTGRLVQEKEREGDGAEAALYTTPTAPVDRAPSAHQRADASTAGLRQFAQNGGQAVHVRERAGCSHAPGPDKRPRLDRNRRVVQFSSSMASGSRWARDRVAPGSAVNGRGTEPCEPGSRGVPPYWLCP